MGAQGVTVPGGEQLLPVPHTHTLSPGTAGVVSPSRPGSETWGRHRERRRGALGSGQRELVAAGQGRRIGAAVGAAGPGDVSTANTALKEDCGNGEKFERVVCWSFDQLSATIGRRETWVCVFSCARWLGVSLARKAAFRGNPAWGIVNSDTLNQQRSLKRFHESK